MNVKRFYSYEKKYILHLEFYIFEYVNLNRWQFKIYLN